MRPDEDDADVEVVALAKSPLARDARLPTVDDSDETAEVMLCGSAAVSDDDAAFVGMGV